MSNSCFIRKIDELGRIVIPVEIRQALGIKEKDPLEISLINNSILLQKNQSTCVFCNSIISLISFGDKFICKNCTKKLKDGVYNER